MAGAKIEVTFEDSEIRHALNRMASRARDMTPLMRDIGEHLLTTTRERFVDQESPDGTPWAPLAEGTRARKRHNADKILTESGILRGQLVYQAGRDRVEVGSPTIYAGTHQFGAAEGAFGATSKGAPIPFGDIPARPFLGVSAEDGREIVALVNDHLESALR